MDIKAEQPDWVDDSNRLVDINIHKHPADSYIRQLLTVTFGEIVRLDQVRGERKVLAESMSKIENDW